MALINSPFQIPKTRTQADLAQAFDQGTPAFGAAPAQFALPMPLLDWSPATDVPKTLTGSLAGGLGGISSYVGDTFADENATESNFLQDVGESLGASQDYWLERTTHGAQQRAGMGWTQPGADSAWQAPLSTGVLQLTQAVGSSGPTVAALAAGGGPVSFIVAGVLEGAIAAGQGTRDIREEVLGMDAGQLRHLPPFQEALKQGASEEEAKLAVAKAAADEMRQGTFATTAALGAAGGAIGGRWAGRQASRWGRTKAGAVAEAPPEVLQGIGEEYWAARAAQRTFDPNREPDYLEAGVSSAILGTAMGAGGGAISPGRPQPQPVPQPEKGAQPGALPGGLPGAMPGGVGQPTEMPSQAAGAVGPQPESGVQPGVVPGRFGAPPGGAPGVTPGGFGAVPGGPPGAMPGGVGQPMRPPSATPEPVRPHVANLTHESETGFTEQDVRQLPLSDGRRIDVNAQQLRQDPQLRVKALYAVNAPGEMMTVTNPADIEVQVDYAMNRLPRSPEEGLRDPMRLLRPGEALPPGGVGVPASVATAPQQALQGRIRTDRQQAEALGQAPLTDEQRQEIAQRPPLAEAAPAGALEPRRQAELQELTEQRREYRRQLRDERVTPTQRARLEEKIGAATAGIRALTGNLGPTGAAVVGEERRDMSAAVRKGAGERRRRETELESEISALEKEITESPSPLRRKVVGLKWSRRQAELQESRTGKKPPRREITEREYAEEAHPPTSKVGLNARVRRRQVRLAQMKRHRAAISDLTRPTPDQEKIRKEMVQAKKDRVQAESAEFSARGVVEEAETATAVARKRYRDLAKKAADIPAREKYRRRKELRQEFASLVGKRRLMEESEARLDEAQRLLASASEVVARARAAEQSAIELHEMVRAELLDEREVAKGLVPPLPQAPEKIKSAGQVRTAEEKVKAASERVRRDPVLLRSVRQTPEFVRAFTHPSSPMRASGEFGDKVRRVLLAAMQAVAEKIDPKTRPKDRAVMEWAMQKVRDSSERVKEEDLRDFGQEQAPQGFMPEGLNLDLDDEIEIIVRHQVAHGTRALRDMPTEADLQTAKEETNSLAGLRRVVGSVMDAPVRDASMLQGFLKALPIMERERPGAIRMFEEAFGAIFKAIPARSKSLPKQMVGKREVRGEAVLDYTGETRKAAPTGKDTARVHLSEVAIMDKVLGLIDKLFTQDVRKQAQPVEFTKQRVELAETERKVVGSLTDEMNSLIARANAVVAPIQGRIDAMTLARSMIRKQEKFTSALGKTRTRESRWAAFKKSRNTAKIAGEIADVAHAAGFDAHADALRAAKAHPWDTNFYEGVARRTRSGAMRKLVKDWNALEEVERKAVPLSKDHKLAVINDLLSAMHRDAKAQKKAITDARGAVMSGSELLDQILALPKIKEDFGAIRAGIASGEAAVRDAATKLQRLETLTREHIAPLREAAENFRVTGLGKTRRIFGGMEILDRIDILANYLTATGSTAGLGIVEAKDNLLVRDPDLVNKSTILMVVDDVVNKALLGLRGAVESEYVANQPKESKAGEEFTDADTNAVRKALIEESGRAQDTDEPGSGDQRGRNETPVVYLASKRVPVRSRLHEEFATLEFDEDQVPAIEAINEGLRTGDGFLLNDEQGFGKTVEMMAGAVQTILNGEGIVPVKDKGRPHRILVVTPDAENFREDAENPKFGVAPLLKKHGIEIVLTATASQNVEDLNMRALTGEPAGKLHDYAAKGYDVMLFDEVHKFATPDPVSPAFAMLWNLMKDKQANGVQPKVVFSTGTFADKPRDTWPLAFVEGIAVREWWDRLGVRAVVQAGAGKRELEIKAPENRRTTDKFLMGVMDRARGIADRLTTEYKIVRREMVAPSIEEMTAPLDDATIDKGLDDLAEALGMGAKEFKELLVKTQSNIARATRLGSAQYNPQARPDHLIYLAELQKLPVAARQAAEAVRDKKRPIVMVNQVNRTQYGPVGKASGMPEVNPPTVFETLFEKYLEEMNVPPEAKPVGHFWRGTRKTEGYKTVHREFQRGDYQVLFTNYAKAAEGINLHHGENTAEGQRVLIMAQRSNNYKQNLQAAKRVIRRGQLSEPIIRLLFNERRFESDGYLAGASARAEGFYNVLAARKGEAPHPETLKKAAVNRAPYFTREIPGVALDERHVKLNSRLSKKEKQILGGTLLKETKVRQLFFGPGNENSAVFFGDDLQFHVIDNKGSTRNIDAFYAQLDRYMKGQGYEKAKGYDPVQGMVPSGPDLESAVAVMLSAKESVRAMRPVNRRLKKLLDTLPGLQRGASINDILDVIADGNEPTAWLAKALRQLDLQVPVRFDVHDLGHPAVYDVNERTILVGLGAQGRPKFAHLMLHEAVHAATIHGLRADPRLREVLAGIYRQALQAGIEQGNMSAEIVNALQAGQALTPEQRKELANQGLYGLTNFEEFISEAFLSPEIKALLTHESVQPGQRNLLEQIWDAVASWLDRMLGTALSTSDQGRSLMDELRQNWGDLFQTESRAAQFWESTRDFAGPPAAFEMGEQATKLVDALKIGRQKYVDPHVGLPRADLSRRRGAEVYYKSRTDLLNEGRTYARDDELNDLLDAFVREKDQQVQEATRLKKGSETLVEGWDDEMAKAPSQMHLMHDMMGHSTMQQVYLDKEFSDEAHDHLRKFERIQKDGTIEEVSLNPSQVDGARQQYERLRRDWDAANFTTLQKAIYSDVYAATEQRWNELTRALLENVLRVYAPKASQALLENLTARLHGNSRLPDGWQAISANGAPFEKQDGKEAKAQRRKLARILAQTVKRGPYFPLRREGQLVVSAEKRWKDEFFPTKAARKDRMQELYARDRTIKFRTEKVGNLFVLQPYEYAVEMFDSFDEAMDFRQRMQGAGFETKDPQKRRDFSQRRGVITGTDLDRALKDLPEDSKERHAVVGFFLDMHPGTSIQHALRHRKNVRGADPEMARAFAQYVRASSHHMAQLKHGHRIAKALKLLRNYVTRSAAGHLGYRDPEYTYQMDTIVGELERREDDYQLENEQKMDYAGKVNRFMFLYTLAQPAFLLMNATQVPLATAPILAARFGIGETQRALSDTLRAIGPDFMRRLRGTGGSILRGKANREFFEFLEDDNGALSPGAEFISNIQRSDLANKEDVIRAVTDLGEMGRLDLTLSAILQQVQSQTETTASRWTNKFMDLARGPVQVVETGNRVWTGVAAYTLYRNENEAGYRKAGKDQNLHRDAVAYAAQIIDETQVNYSEADAPRWMARTGVFGSFAPVLFMYKRYAHYMHMNFIRNAYRAINTKGLSAEEVSAARKSVAYLTATHVAAAGALGLPQLAKMTAALAFTLFKDDEDPRNFDEWARAGLQEAFGDLGGEIVAHGLPRIINVDMSASLGLDNAFLFSDELRGRQGEDWLKELGYLLGGPAVGVAGRLATIPEFVQKGEYWRAAELLAPKVFRNFMQAGRYSEEGVTDRSGDVIRVSRDIDGWELIQRTIGLQSGSTAEFYEGRSAITAARRFFTQKRKALLARYRGGARGAAFERDLAEYNNAVPAPGLKITSDTLEQIRSRSGAKAESQFGLSLPRTQTGLESYGAWANM